MILNMNNIELHGVILMHQKLIESDHFIESYSYSVPFVEQTAMITDGNEEERLAEE